MKESDIRIVGDALRAILAVQSANTTAEIAQAVASASAAKAYTADASLLARIKRVDDHFMVRGPDGVVRRVVGHRPDIAMMVARGLLPRNAAGSRPVVSEVAAAKACVAQARAALAMRRTA